jgi:branched-chain amino acid transport system permease protein
MTRNESAVIVVALGALALPFIAGEYWTGLITQIYIFGLLALGVDLMLGHTGLMSLCHAAFFSVAAYTTAILQVRHGVPAVAAAPAGVVLGTVLAAVFAMSVRTRGVYFILITIALGYVVWGVEYRWSSFTGGDNGVTNVPRPVIAGIKLDTAIAYYYFVVAVIAVVLIAYRRLIRSPFGLALHGLKSSETRMTSLGFHAGKHLFVAFVISGFIASLAGVLYVYYNRFVNPVSASFPISVEAVLMAIMGGTGTIAGPFIGSGVFLGLRNWVSNYVELHMAVIGVVFIATILWAPQGVMGLVKRWRERGRTS